MKSFTEAVKYDQEKQGLHVFKILHFAHSLKIEPIDLICMKNGVTTFIRARGNGHNNLNHITKMKLQQLGKQCGARVLHAKVNGEDEIVFFRIYER